MSTQPSGLGEFLLGKTRGAILALLYGRNDRSFYLREIARETGVSAGAVQRELENLVRFGLVDRLQTGLRALYRVRREHPVYAEMRALVAKTAGAYQMIGAALEPIKGKVSVAFAYGSMARGEENSDSDVDLLIVGDASLDEVLAQLAPVEKKLGRPVNPTVYPLAEFRNRLKQGNHFLQAILRGKRVLILGDEDELEEMGRIRMAPSGAHKPGRDSIASGNRAPRSQRRSSGRSL
jgi:predicted nucleotidyltransferase